MKEKIISETAESKKHKKIQTQLEMLKSIILIFAPFFCYDILGYLKLKKSNIEGSDSPEEKGFEQKREKVCGLYLKDWPQDIKTEYFNLFGKLPLEQGQDLFAEIHYFLIYYIATYSMKYFTGTEKTLLDHLFNESFSDRELWPKKYPAIDAFERYNKTKISGGPLLEFAQRINQITGLKNSYLEGCLFIRIGTSFKHIVQLFIKDTFSETGHKFFKTD